MGQMLDSLVAGGCIISGGRVERSIFAPEVRVNSYAQVEESILMERGDVGRHAKIRRAIIDKDVKIPPGFQIGYDPEEDAKRFSITPGGIVVIPAGMILDAPKKWSVCFDAPCDVSMAFSSTQLLGSHQENRGYALGAAAQHQGLHRYGIHAGVASQYKSDGEFGSLIARSLGGTKGAAVSGRGVPACIYPSGGT